MNNPIRIFGITFLFPNFGLLSVLLSAGLILLSVAEAAAKFNVKK